MSRFSVEAVFKAVDKITAPVDKMQRRVARFSKSAQRNFSSLDRSISNVNGSIKSLSQKATVGLGVASAAMLKVIDIGADFEQSLVNAAAKMPGEIRKGTKDFALLEEAAKKTGSTTEFSATQAANALNFLAMAGFDAKSSIAALPVVVDLATAAQTDLATASDIATDTLGAFGLSSKNAAVQAKNLTRVSNVLAKTSTSANTSMEQLFEAMKKGGPTATKAGADIETVAAMIGTMANAGIKADVAGTAVQNSFLNLTKPSANAQKIIKRLGIEVLDANKNLRPMADIIDSINSSTKGLSETQKLGVVETLLGREGLAGNITLLSEGGDALRRFTKLNKDATGASKTMADVMRNTVRGSINSLKSAIEGVSIQIFSMNKGPLKDTIDNMTKWVRQNEKMLATKITQFFVDLFDILKNIAKWGDEILITVAAVWALVTALKAFVLVMTVVNILMAMNPIGLIVLGVSVLVIAIIAAIASIISWWDELKAVFKGVWDWAEELSKGAVGWFMSVPGKIMESWAKIGVFFKELWAGIIKIFDDAVLAITSFFDSMLNSITDVFNKLSKIPGLANLSFVNDTGFEKEERKNERSDDILGQTFSPEIVSTADMITTQINESFEKSVSEVTIKDETGRAEITGGSFGTGLMLLSTGAD